jgi:hypothetical protein
MASLRCVQEFTSRGGICLDTEETAGSPITSPITVDQRSPTPNLRLQRPSNPPGDTTQNEELHSLRIFSSALCCPFWCFGVYPGSHTSLQSMAGSSPARGAERNPNRSPTEALQAPVLHFQLPFYHAGMGAVDLLHLSSPSSERLPVLKSACNHDPDYTTHLPDHGRCRESFRHDWG